MQSDMGEFETYKSRSCQRLGVSLASWKGVAQTSLGPHHQEDRHSLHHYAGQRQQDHRAVAPACSPVYGEVLQATYKASVLSIGSLIGHWFTQIFAFVEAF